MDKFISIKSTCERTSLSRTSLWRKVRDGKFPKPVPLGDGIRKAFVESEVTAWIAGRVAERDREVA
ncbi:AlpA family phage regulatory protein [Aurantimonas sp. 22II-16-19i]|uniref:helix-turn-helix transcriptional regulator n=1 Tax=Aurantimonas sp. 22II-16-19i TaxID=1317114 RepID=UPI0009F7A5ED|nr:AlpA family phage regulatory protein [Aurantimonas sp. 22II-16-19i]ORE97474.1 transcriptional regulator [Aurantimonas sp. 22II-16-19i]